MLGSADLLRAWVLTTLGQLATDDEHHARLRETLLVFLDTGGSYKATAERLMLHKNSVQYRIRRAEESLGRPVADHRHDVELALQASRWLGSSVLQPAAGRNLPGPCVEGCGVTTARSSASYCIGISCRCQCGGSDRGRIYLLFNHVRFCSFVLQVGEGSADTPQGAATSLLYRRKSSFAPICQTCTICRAIPAQPSTQPDICSLGRRAD